MQRTSRAVEENGATVGYYAKLRCMADGLRGIMNAEHKHAVLGVISARCSAPSSPGTSPTPSRDTGGG
jgi:hypothetical protein